MRDLDYYNKKIICDSLTNGHLIIDDYDLKNIGLQALFENEKRDSKPELFKQYNIINAISFENLSGEPLIKKVYQEILGRIPSDEEIEYNLKLINKNKIRGYEFIELICCSREAEMHDILVKMNHYSLNYFIRLSNEDFLNVVYNLLLDRKPDKDGYEHFLKMLLFKKISKTEIIYYILHSEEFKGSGRHVDINKLLLFYRIKRFQNGINNVPILGIIIKAHRELKNINIRLQITENKCAELERKLSEEQLLLEQEKNISNLKSVFLLQKIDEIEEKLKKEDEYSTIDYEDFENHFRGSRDYIKKAQEIYVQFFIGKKNVLDLGCGRGEFTELLTENNIGVTGIDLYKPYIEYMQKLNLNAYNDDIINYLENFEGIADGIFVGQVVEHMKIGQIMKMCELAYKKMDNGAYIVIETPNPTSLAIFTNSFYIDPSHNKPVHPATLKYILEKVGFEVTDVLFTENSKINTVIPKIEEGNECYNQFNEATEKVSNLLFGSQDYAIIARK